MRKYQGIWEQVKKQGTASIKAAPELHPRITKAVGKEKQIDEAYKFLLSESHKDAILNTSITGEVLTFTLSMIIKGSTL